MICKPYMDFLKTQLIYSKYTDEPEYYNYYEMLVYHMLVNQLLVNYS